MKREKGTKSIRVELPDWTNNLSKKYIDKIRKKLDTVLKHDTELKLEIQEQVDYDKKSKDIRGSKDSYILPTKSGTHEWGKRYDSWEGQYQDYTIYRKGKNIGTACLFVANWHISFEHGGRSSIGLKEDGTYDDMRLADCKGPTLDITFEKDTKIKHKDLALYGESYFETVIGIYQKLFDRVIEEDEIEFKLDPSKPISINDICPTNFLENIITLRAYEDISRSYEVDIEEAFLSQIYKLEESPTGLKIIADDYYDPYE
tara:strand:+ start:415 stop:1191 length:777 start_codon:yes stop_codon:yes gene_type:complete